MHVKEDCAEFLDTKRIKDIVKRYSNFVPFPIKVNGEQVHQKRLHFKAMRIKIDSSINLKSTNSVEHFLICHYVL